MAPLRALPTSRPRAQRVQPGSLAGARRPGREAANDPAFRAALSSDGSAVAFNTPAGFAAVLPGELQKYQGLTRQLGIKLE
jgi:hypothetical protein